MASFWIGVACKDHVLRGVAGGFCQLGHGKAAHLERLRPHDWIIYYSPRERLEGGGAVQAFTAIGQIREGEVYQAAMPNGFCPFRRDVDFRTAQDAPIRPLLDVLMFTTGRSSWGQSFRYGAFKIAESDFDRIASAMQAGIVNSPSAENAQVQQLCCIAALTNEQSFA